MKKLLKILFNAIVFSTILYCTAMLPYDMAFATEQKVEHIIPKKWNKFAPILRKRAAQSHHKMKLSKSQVESFIQFLRNIQQPTPSLLKLQTILPKTTLELLRSIEGRGVTLSEAEKIAAYLENLYANYKFKNPSAFDENTSHIIGRYWCEIDYSGENMTWKKQQQKYKPFGVTNFKTLENIMKFFNVEENLPYFRKIYKPQK